MYSRNTPFSIGHRLQAPGNLCLAACCVGWLSCLGERERSGGVPNRVGFGGLMYLLRIGQSNQPKYLAHLINLQTLFPVSTR